MATNKEILKALEKIEKSLPNGDLEICRSHLEDLQQGQEQLGESLETGERYFDPESYANMNEGSMEGMMRDDNLLTYLMDEEKAHDSINSLIQENEIKNADTPSSPGSRVRGPLDAIGHTLAEYLIGQNPETGEIPTQPYPYNPLMNLLNLPPGNQMKTGGPPFAQVSAIKEIMKLLK